MIHNGRIIQEGSPEEVFRKPMNKFVARYAGIRNFFRVRFLNDSGTWKALCDGNLEFRLAAGKYPADGLLIVRSDAIKIHNGEPSGGIEIVIKGL